MTCHPKYETWMGQELTWLKKSTKIIAKKGIKTLQGKNLPSSREFISHWKRECRRRFSTIPFRIPGKKGKKAGELRYWDCCNTIITIRGASLFLGIWSGWTKDGLPESSSQIHLVSKDHWTIATSTINLLRAWVSKPCWVSWTCKKTTLLWNPKPHQSVTPIGF